MKVLQINTVYGEGSTGKIAKEIHDLCVSEKIECLSAYRCAKKGQAKLEDSIEISSAFDSRLHGLLSRFTMFKGCFSFFKTLSFLRKVKRYSPDLIHLHNLHGSYINLPLLFNYIKKNNIPVVWTLHDCWAFTAICSHFEFANCCKWKNGCNACPQKKRFSSCPFDFTKKVWQLKRKWFTGVERLVIVTPSNWLMSVVKRSFLQNYQAKTIYNGINLSVFCATSSDFRNKFGLEDKKIVLGVAFGWGYGKGLDVFVDLAKRLDENYRIVLVGVDGETKKNLPKNIISISRTNDQKELAEIYTSADVFVNPTREEVLGLVNIESLACGTPVVTFSAGGSAECIDGYCGSSVALNDVDALEKEIIRICDERPYSKENCVRRAFEFDYNKKISEYITLYKDMAR